MAVDDEALSWGGDVRDPTHVDGPGRGPAVRPQALPPDSPDADRPPADGGSLLLVVYGAIGAAYLLFTIGWVLTIVRAGVSLPNPFFDVMYRVGGWSAVAAPAAWFGLTFLLTRASSGRRATALRILWLGVGLILLAPWPFIVGGAS